MVRATDNPLNPAYPANTLRSGIESRNITDASRPVAAACDILGEQLRFSTMSEGTQAKHWSAGTNASLAKLL